jgi:hypothetical protein
MKKRKKAGKKQRRRKVMVWKRMEMKMRRLRQPQANGQLKMVMLIPRSRRLMRMTR